MSQKPDMTWKVGLAILASIVVIVAVLIGVALVIKGWNLGTTLGLPILAIAGIVLLLATLTVVSIVFSLFGIEDAREALGLPNGSIRAVIALSLIVLFGILSVYLYGSLSDGAATTATFDNLSPATAKAIETNLQPSQLVVDVPSDLGKPTETHRLFVKTAPDAASVDFAKQLMTLMGTLVTAIASFYFGSATAAKPDTSGAGTGSPGGGSTKGGSTGGGVTGNTATPSLKTISPDTVPAGGAPVKLNISGEGLEGVNAVTLTHEKWSDIVASDVVSTAMQVAFGAIIPAEAPKGPWTVKVAGSAGEAQLANALQVS